MSSTALLLNVVVAGMAMLAYHQSGHYHPRLIWPFLAGSLPAALLGSKVHLSYRAYHLLLAAVLAYTALRMLTGNHNDAQLVTPHPPSWPLALISGAGIGLLSGVVGIGGGIFLSLIIVLGGWGNAKHAASASSIFVIGTSLSGLVGRAIQHTLYFNDWTLVLLPVALVGALGGGWLGARRFSPIAVRRLLGTMLLLVAVRIWITM